jgi:glyoxylase-like metal-dependent hydrolase (beta-lactamase superfamily II)
METIDWETKMNENNAKETSEGVFPVPGMVDDRRVHVFRRNFTMTGEFEGMEVDAYVVITNRYVVVLDTLLCPEDAQTMMQAVSKEVADRTLLVVNSHADWDHAWGNAYFSGERTAPIIAHDYGLVRLQSEEERNELADFQSRYALFRSVQLIPPTITFNHHLTISGGDLTLELFAAPGHQRDHIACWIPQLRLLFGFDAIEKPLPCMQDATSVPAMFATLESFLALQPLRVLCSHGKVTDPVIVSANLSYLREIERRCLGWLQAHQPTKQDLEHGSDLIHYPLDEVIAGSNEPVDRTFYSWAHDANIRAIMQWLMTK